MTCRIPVQISEYWTIALAVRCELSEQIYVLSVIEEVDRKKPTYQIIAAPVEKAGDNIVYVKVLPWSQNGDYHFENPPGRPLCSFDPIALGAKVEGQVLLMTQNPSNCRTTFEPIMSGDDGKRQRWVFSTGEIDPGAVCYSWEYLLLGGKNSDEVQVLQCAGPEPAVGGRLFRQTDSDSRADAKVNPLRLGRHRGAQAEQFPTRVGAAPGVKKDCSDVEDCPPPSTPDASIYLISAATGGFFQSCEIASAIPKYYMTPVPFNMFTTCKGQNRRLNIKDALALYRQSYIFQQGCAEEQPLARYNKPPGSSTDDCLFIALNDCSGYSPRYCGPSF